MGVTAHFFAFDPHVYTTPPTVDRLIEWGELDDELVVQSKASGWLRELHSHLGSNKKWYDNLAGDWAWGAVREQVAPKERGAIDRWLSHLFWDPEPGQGCDCGLTPSAVADGESIYDDALLRHVLALETDLAPAMNALQRRWESRAESESFDREHVHEPEGFEFLVRERQAIFERATSAGAGWSLLQWIWI